MRRALVILMILGLMAGAVATAEAKKKPKPKPQPPPPPITRFERTVEGSYGPYPAPVTGCNAPLDPFACLIVPTSKSEHFFTAKVTDTHGQPVFFEVSGTGMGNKQFCGETEGPVRFQPGVKLSFAVAFPIWGIQTVCPQHSVKTTGTIRVTLSNLPAPD